MRKKILLVFGCALLAAGALSLLWYERFLMNMRRAQHSVEQFLDYSKEQNEQPAHIPCSTETVRPTRAVPVGRLEIPRLHLSVIVLEGTAPKTLEVAAGHIRGTALPGATGNIAIAAHRDTFFRPLREVRPHDSVVLTTECGSFTYTVDSTEVVNPHNVSVLHKTNDAQLTLVTCFPFTYIGPAPERFIVHAHKQS